MACGAPIACFLKVEFVFLAANSFDGTRRANPKAFAMRALDNREKRRYISELPLY